MLSTGLYGIKSRLWAFVLLLFCSAILWTQEIPESFANHKVKRGETLFSLSQKYQVTIPQILEYNPVVEKVGLKKRMRLRIPVYAEKTVKEEPSSVAYQIHEVQPKETKWRLAYQYGITIRQLDSLNPILKDGLKIGQEIKVPVVVQTRVIPEKDADFNYYKVLPKEGYYRIEKKTGVSQKVLDSLNPNLLKTGLQPGLILKIPGSNTGNFKVVEDLLVERISLLDSIKNPQEVKLALMLPFKVHQIDLDSIHDTKRLLTDRNLHRIAFDFYSGVRMALQVAAEAGVSVQLSVFDTENNKGKLQDILMRHDFSKTDAIIGPLIPSNFDFLSRQRSVENIAKVSPLSANPVVLRKNVFQSVVQEKSYREKTFDFLRQELDTLQNVVIVADSLNRAIEEKLMAAFPRALRLRPEPNGYLLPKMVDSLLTDSLPNKVIVETDFFPLISSAISQMSAQNTADRNVQVYTTFRSNAYENENLNPKQMGRVCFTFALGYKPLNDESFSAFQQAYIRLYGKPPNREAVRGFDLSLDTILRIAFSGTLAAAVAIGETDYESNRFYYVPTPEGGFQNKGIYILQHQDYGVVELKK